MGQLAGKAQLMGYVMVGDKPLWLWMACMKIVGNGAWVPTFGFGAIGCNASRSA